MDDKTKVQDRTGLGQYAESVPEIWQKIVVTGGERSPAPLEEESIVWTFHYQRNQTDSNESGNHIDGSREVKSYGGLYVP